MKKVLAFEQLPNTSASERIQAVNQSSELDQADQEITKLLINTLNFDENINVRLAACQALIRFENEPDVREALIQSLKIQTDPNIQITLIDALVAIKEKRAVEEIQRLVQDRQVLDIVRQKAEEGIHRLTHEGNTPS
ncbi:HEAT repeat domain-containing protein [Spirosoma telluris]|uniref:HEAT repeat domain-containing protein n=1 Tax=Spirosoma telluris TaxID=2183553 RepID=UPI002FC35020